MKALFRPLLLTLPLLLAGCDSPAPGAGTPTAAAPAAAPAPKPPAWPFLADGTQSALAVEEMLRANYYVVFDGSGSMGDRGCSAGKAKIAAAQGALASFGALVPEAANLGLAVFDGSGLRERLPLGRSNRPAFTREVNGVWAGGGTPLKSALRLGYDRLTEQARLQLGFGEYHLVVVTDGEANSGEDPTPVVDELLGRSPVLLHTIGFCIGTDHSLNQPGRTDYRAANDPAALSQGLAAVLAEAPGFTIDRFDQGRP